MRSLLIKYRGLNKTVKASIWFVICGVMQRGITVLTTPIFTRLMSTYEYGVFSVFNSWLEILTVICTFRICYGIYMKGLIKYEDDRDNYTVSLLGLSELLILIFLMIYFIFKNQINNLTGLTTSMMICLFILILTNTWYSFWSSRERVDFRYKNLVKITLLIAILKPIVGIIFIKLSNNNAAFYRILGITLVELLVYIWLYISQRKKSRHLFNKTYWIEAFKFNIVLVPHYLSQIILNHSDRIMIQHFCGYDDVGAYSLAYSLAMLLTIINTAFLNTLTPWNYKKLKEKKYDDMKRISIITLIIIAVLNIILVLLAPEIIAFFAPKSYHMALYVIPPVSIGVYLIFLYGLFVNVEMYYDKTKFIMFASCCGAILNVILNFIFIPKYGFISAAYTTLFSYIVYVVLHCLNVYNIEKAEKIKNGIYDRKKIIYISIVFNMIVFLILLLYEINILRYSLLVLIIVLAFSNRNKLKKYINSLIEVKKEKKTK